MNKNVRYLLIVIVFLMCILTPPAFTEDTHRVEIFAHHGVLEDVPENTFAALRRAVELGLDGIEIDIRQTKDNQLVLMCDETIDRTTDGKGRVDQLLYAEIQQYDAGSWRGAEFKNERVPLLSDVLKFSKMNNLKLILKVRQTALERQVMDLVKASEMSSQVYLGGSLRSLNTENEEPYRKELVFVSPEEMKEEIINRIHEEKKYVFSVIPGADDRKTIKNRIKMGADVVLVDYPCVALDILNIKSQTLTNKRPIKNAGMYSPHQDSKNNAAYIQDQVNTLIKTIEDTDYDKAKAAATALLVIPPKYTIHPLLNLLRNKHPQVRQNAAWTLGFCREKNVAVYLQSLLKDKNAEVRREAVLAINRLDDEQSVPVLIETLKTENDPWVRYDIARTLGTIADRSAVFTLITLLKKEKNWHVKSACVEALGHIRSDSAMNALADILITDAGEEAAWARTKAAWALVEIGEKSIPLLAKALRDKEEVTRRRAGWALVKIGTPAVKTLISSLRELSGFTRERAAQTLGWIGDKSAVTSLIWALKDKEPSVVSSAAWALGRIGSTQALSALQSLVNHENNDIQENAVEAIERITANKDKTACSKEYIQKP